MKETDRGELLRKKYWRRGRLRKGEEGTNDMVWWEESGKMTRYNGKTYTYEKRFNN